MNSSSPSTLARPGRFRQRLCAWMMSHSGSSYDAANEQRKCELLGSLQGAVLEIGPGTGLNLPYFPAEVQWLGVEPNPYMHPMIQQSLLSLGRPAANYRIDPGDPQGVRLPAEDESMDAVVSTLVLCSVPQPAESLAEILRVLKPGGRFVFIEHVAAPRGSRLRAFQNIIQPVWTWVGDGCHPNRETWTLIEQAGFARVELEHYRYPGGGPAAPLIAGTAIK